MAPLHVRTRLIPREELMTVLYPADHIGYTVMDMLEEVIPEQEDVGTFDVETLGVGGRWDNVADAFVLSVRVRRK